ncbi:UAA transporter [Multifurca ochricompacta]|uniref:UDP-galactose transporter homolog 1 n=1 Tax=Multifurca ochricompacta TaxID=376703 RepID=A0AAD4M6X4_9AGAM|nr:UAA transporter [Multifurca ochricompacta]
MATADDVCLRLAVCVIGVYSMFLLWAISQERLSVPFKSLDGKTSDKFKSPIFLSTCQSALSSTSALAYLFLRRKPGQTWLELLGLSPSAVDSNTKSNGTANGTEANGRIKSNGHAPVSSKHSFKTSLLPKYIQCSFFITFAAPFGFAALSHVSYPAMVLAKSCKLVPVMVMNVLLYRRAFARHKYVVVALVTVGITMFMGLGGEGGKKHGAKGRGNPTLRHNIIGLSYLLINLILDGATNSTQDEIFARYKVSGQQMMLWINLLCTLLTSLISVLPLPYIPVLHPSNGGETELKSALDFIHTHPSIIYPLVQFALTGALGQLFIFETLQHFGSLTLVTITLTRKLFTMLLSVVVYNHKLTPGQWAGTSVVFAGISVEAWVKRRDIHAKQVIQRRKGQSSSLYRFPESARRRQRFRV